MKRSVNTAINSQIKVEEDPNLHKTGVHHHRNDLNTCKTHCNINFTKMLLPTKTRIRNQKPVTAH